MNGHYKSAQYNCQNCDKTFKYKCSLKNHNYAVRMLSGEWTDTWMYGVIEKV